MTPQTLAKSADVALAGDMLFGHAVDEFLDDFYLNPSSRQRRIDVPPVSTGDVTQDAWLGAVGEHLALRWGLVVPTWAEREQHFCLAAPVFVPRSQALQALLYFESPLPFPRLRIFTVAEPLQRARFPR
jgi:hypothetical protein